ncbi:MAG: cation transporting ATPase C-terminal domain-containing protein [Deltaproteobacteria bacterium]|nr:cation transporting ATPase C-terminal domain-containing protein [Deltaproteobacteria bacterium]
MIAGTLGVLSHGLDVGSLKHARALVFTAFVAFQIFNVFNVRDESASALGLETFADRALWPAVGAVMVFQLIVTTWNPVQMVFGTNELSAADGLLAVSVGGVILVVEEPGKTLARALTREGALGGS